MSISRVTAALAAATNDVTVAAANINFDFSLVKVEAPEEFKALGRALSAKRREEAEDGSFHITARKLSALFDQILPAVPELVKRYGIRASEISTSPIANPKGTSADGIFASQVGADGTSIWAAATSGPSAIPVHLLACLLARIFPPAEATSVWVELVNERKQEIFKAF